MAVPHSVADLRSFAIFMHARTNTHAPHVPRPDMQKLCTWVGSITFLKHELTITHPLMAQQNQNKEFCQFHVKHDTKQQQQAIITLYDN